MIGLAASALAGSWAEAEREPVRIGYACERNHPTLDWSPERMRSTDLQLQRDWTPGREPRWAVTAPAAVAGQATAFPAASGSIGGSERLRWSTRDGRRFSAIVSMSDIVGDAGPATLWLDITTPGGRSDKLTCGPMWRRKLTKEAN